MNDDLILRSRLLRDPYFREDRYPVSHLLRTAIMEQPAVDPVTVFKQIGLVKEAFEMAKADLMQVVRCEDCVHWETTKCPLCIVEFSKLPDGSLHKHVIHNFVEDDFWCKKGERRSDSVSCEK